MLPSSDEANRLRKIISGCRARHFKDSDHTLFLVHSILHFSSTLIQLPTLPLNTFQSPSMLDCGMLTLLLFQDGSFDLATVVRAAGSYRRLHRYEPVHDYVQLTNQEFEHYYENNLKYVFLLNQLQNLIGILGFTTTSVFNNFIL